MMTGYLSSKVAVKDSFDDDDASDDVEDEVFIRDGRNGFKVDEESGVKRPLMAPRRKCKNNNIFLPETTKRSFSKRFCLPYCYGLIAIALIIGFVMGATLFLNFIPSPLYSLRLWPLGANKAKLNIIPCTDFISNDIWYKTYPGLKSEAALVSVDVNLDGVEDVIVGYSTDQGSNSCSMFANAQDVCGGGALALDGKNGETIWQYWTAAEVLFVDCAADITGDKIKDCLLSGKGGVLKAIDGKSGTILWGVNSIPRDVLDLYAAQFIPDITSDGFPDVLIAHSLSQSGVLAVLDGKSGKRLGHLDVPDKEGMYTVPRVMVSNDGSEVVLFATGSSETSGTLYATLLTTIAANGPKDVSSIWKSDVGVTSGIIMADMNQDGSEDIILTSGDTLTVLDGNNFQLLWNVSSSSFNKDQNQILIGPTPAYFDDDLIPDLLISHMFGPSFPTIYYSQTWVANGKDGVELLEEPILGGNEVTAPGVAISYSGIGNDMFLYWRTTCNSKSQRKPFYFSKQSDIHDNARADLCRLRFNKSLDIQMYALNQHIEPPGVLIYSSKLKWNIEHNVTEHKVNKKVLPKHKIPENRIRVNKLEKLRKNQELEKIYQEMPKNYPIYDTGDANVLNMLPKFQENDDQRDPMSNIMQPLPALGEINDYDSAYPQDIDSDDNILPVINSRFRNVYERRDEREEKLKNKAETSTRKKRKIQDEKESLPRALATASLAKPISGNGIDVFFSTHWVTPASNVRILSERDERCIRKKVSKEQTNNLNDMDQIEIMAENECLGITENVDEIKYEDLAPIELQMTIFRVNLNCICSNINPKTEECSKALPMEQQSYSHRATNVYYKPRIHPNLSEA